MSEDSDVEIVGENGRRLHLRMGRRHGDDHVWDFEATLSMEGGEVTTMVRDAGDGLAHFFADLGTSWRGWEGRKEWTSLEGQLGLSASHDGLGTVLCTVTLRQPWPPEWRASAVLDFGAGADLERTSTAVVAFVSRS